MLLFCSEFSNFVTLQQTTKLGVDTARDRLLRIHLDLAFPALPCQGTESHYLPTRDKAL